MAVQNQTPFNRYVANGATAVFPYGFVLFSADDLQVFVNGDLLIGGIDYTVSSLGNPAGGEVTMAVIPNSLADVLLQRAVIAERLTDYQTAGDFRAETVNRDFDRLWTAAQDYRADVARSIKFRLGDGATSEITATSAERAGHFLSFDGLGNPVPSVSTDPVVIGANEALAQTLVARDAAEQAAAAAEEDRIQTGLDAEQTAADRVQTGLDASATAADRVQTQAARDAALLSRGIFPTTAAAIGQGVAGTSALVGGSGGTNGTFALGFSGGTQVIAPQGRFVVAGGAVTQVIIDYPGYYSAGTPTISFAASSGLTGASATAIMGPNTPVGSYFSTPASPDYLQLNRVDAGPVAVAVGSPYPSSATVAAIRTDIGGPDLYNLLTEPESLYADTNLIVTDFDVTLTTETFNGRKVLKATQGAGLTNLVSIQSIPVTAFAATGKVSFSAYIEDAGASAALDAVRFIAIRQTDEAGTSVQTDSITLPATAISGQQFKIENISINGSAKRIDFRIRRNGADMRLGRMVVTSVATASERPLNLAREILQVQRLLGYSQSVSAIERIATDWATSSSNNFTPRQSFSVDGLVLGAYTASGDNNSALNPYVVGSDAYFEANKTGEVTVVVKKLTASAARLLLAAGASGRSNLNRTFYSWNTTGQVQSFPGTFVGGTELLAADAGRAIAQDNIVTIRLRRNADGTGLLGITPQGGAEQTVALSNIPTGRVWFGTRNGAASTFSPAEFRSLNFTATPSAGGSDSARIAVLEALAGNPIPVLRSFRILPDGINGASTGGFTATGLDLIGGGKFAGCWLVGCDGRKTESAVSPPDSSYNPTVYVIDRAFTRILATFTMPYSGASVQGVAYDSSDQTFWVATAGDLKIRHFNLYGGSAGAEIPGDVFDWSAAGYSSQPNGLAYDPVHDGLLVGQFSGTTLRRISCDPAATPRLQATFTLGRSDPDQFHYDAARNNLFYSYGANGTQGNIRCFNTDTPLDTFAYGPLRYAEAIEGIHINRDTGELTVINDGGFHDTSTQPALNTVITYAVKVLA